MFETVLVALVSGAAGAFGAWIGAHATLEAAKVERQHADDVRREEAAKGEIDMRRQRINEFVAALSWMGAKGEGFEPVRAAVAAQARLADALTSEQQAAAEFASEAIRGIYNVDGTHGTTRLELAAEAGRLIRRFVAGESDSSTLHLDLAAIDANKLRATGLW